MDPQEKYIVVVKTFDDYVTIRDWAIKFNGIYPQTQDEYSVKIRKIFKTII